MYIYRYLGLYKYIYIIHDRNSWAISSAFGLFNVVLFNHHLLQEPKKISALGFAAATIPWLSVGLNTTRQGLSPKGWECPSPIAPYDSL